MFTGELESGNNHMHVQFWRYVKIEDLVCSQSTMTTLTSAFKETRVMCRIRPEHWQCGRRINGQIDRQVNTYTLEKWSQHKKPGLSQYPDSSSFKSNRQITSDMSSFTVTDPHTTMLYILKLYFVTTCNLLYNNT